MTTSNTAKPPPRTMRREEWWREHYRENRDLDHLSPEALSERLFDGINNYRIRTQRGKLGLLSPDDGGKQWSIYITQVFEECSLRGYKYPGPITISAFGSALDKAFDPIPNIEEVIARRNLDSNPYLLKFGDPVYLKPALDYGRFRIAPASFYASAEHNHARRDTELKRILTPNPRNSHGRDFLASRGIVGPSGSPPKEIVIEARTDYYLFSLCSAYSARLFGDFGATGCLVIYDPAAFCKRLFTAIEDKLPGWDLHIGPISYYDPVRIDPNQVDVRFFKAFRHAYQKELRLTATPQVDTAHLEPFEIELGGLNDCAELVDVETCPPIIFPPDPEDARVIRYGTIKEDSRMVTQLPDVAKLQGMMLNREGNSHKDWYFAVQYTDERGN